MADGVTVNIFGNRAIIDAFDAYGAEVQAEVQAKLDDIGQVALDLADEYVPVLTGYLKSRNQVEVQPGQIIVSNDADYALFVELGTHKMAAQPFLIPAMEQAGQLLKSELEGL